MSSQQEVNLFLKNETKTIEKNVRTVKLFIDKKYVPVLSTKYEDDHVVIKSSEVIEKSEILEENGKCKFIITSSFFGRVYELDSDSIFRFNESKLDLFLKNYDHFVNAFKIIVESYDIEDNVDLTGMTVFGQSPNRPRIAIEKTDGPRTVTVRDAGYYVSKKIQAWIQEFNHCDIWETSGFELEVNAGHCCKDGDTLKLGVHTGKYIPIDSNRANLTKIEQQRFIDNFDEIAKGFKALSDAFNTEDIGIDTTGGIVF